MSSGSIQAPRLNGSVPGIPGAVNREVETLPTRLPGGSSIGPLTEAMPNALLFEVPGVARYLIRDGTSIDVAIAPAADRSAAQLFLDGSARGTLIHQRGELALAAATVLSPDFRCVAICGPSAFGKSTLAAALCRRGWRLIADDITRITWNGVISIAWPGNAAVKLWRDACAMLGWHDCDRLSRVRNGLEKFHVPVPPAPGPAALTAIVRLRMDIEPGLVALPSAACERLLREHTFRPGQIEPLGRGSDHARIVGQVAQGCRPLRLDGSRRCNIHQLADLLSEAMR